MAVNCAVQMTWGHWRMLLVPNLKWENILPVFSLSCLRSDWGLDPAFTGSWCLDVLQTHKNLSFALFSITELTSVWDSSMKHVFLQRVIPVSDRSWIIAAPSLIDGQRGRAGWSSPLSFAWKESFEGWNGLALKYFRAVLLSQLTDCGEVLAESLRCLQMGGNNRERTADGSFSVICISVNSSSTYKGHILCEASNASSICSASHRAAVPHENIAKKKIQIQFYQKWLCFQCVQFMSSCRTIDSFVHLSVRHSIHLSVCPSIHSSIHQSIHQSHSPAVRPSICLSTQPSSCPSVRRLSIH